jgi:hypothetical protein
MINAKNLTNGNGKIIFTIPDDGRGEDIQRVIAEGTKIVEEYCEGVKAYHWRKINKDMIMTWVNKAKLEVDVYQPIDYGHFMGHGLVCSKRKD